MHEKVVSVSVARGECPHIVSETKARVPDTHLFGLEQARVLPADLEHLDELVFASQFDELESILQLQSLIASNQIVSALER